MKFEEVEAGDCSLHIVTYYKHVYFLFVFAYLLF